MRKYFLELAKLLILLLNFVGISGEENFSSIFKFYCCVIAALTLNIWQLIYFQQNQLINQIW